MCFRSALAERFPRRDNPTFCTGDRVTRIIELHIVVVFSHGGGMNLFPYDAEDLAQFLVAGKTWQQWCEEREVLGVSARENVWISAADVNALLSAGGAASLSIDGEVVATAGNGDCCAGETVIALADSFVINYVWDLLKVNEQVIKSLPKDKIDGEVHENAVIEGTVHIGEGTRILPGVYIEGNVVIGKNAKIGPNCYIRGNTSIGDHCHIGQSVEVKNSMIGNNTNIGHLSYIGDSILGHNANLGAGTITSNFRHDGKNHLSMIGEELIDTGRRKFGAIIADEVHTGINTSIYPGRKLGKNVTTLPGEVIKRDKI